MPEGSNPCRHQTKYRERPRERFLTGAKYRGLGRAPEEIEADGAASVHAAAVIRLPDADRMSEERYPDAAVKRHESRCHIVASRGSRLAHGRYRCRPRPHGCSRAFRAATATPG